MLTPHARAEATYLRHRAQLQHWGGWYALVRGDRLGGVFSSYEAAAAAWMCMYGPVPALIRLIEPVAASTSPAAAGGSMAVTIPGDAITETAADRLPPSHAALGWIRPAVAAYAA